MAEGKNSKMEINAKRLTEIRNELYNNIPYGEIKDAWRFIQIIKVHLQKLDEFIDSMPSPVNKQMVVNEKKLFEYDQKSQTVFLEKKGQVN